MLALLTDGLGSEGGIGRYNRHLLSALAHSSSIARITVLPRFAAQADVDGKIEHLAPSSGRLAWCLRALRLALTSRPDIIFCGHIYAAPLAAALAQARSAKLWLQVHGIEAWERPRRPIIDAVERADLVTSVSRYTRRRLLEWSNVDPASVRVLPNTLTGGYAARLRRPDLVARWGLEGKKTILTVGRLASGERYKGHDRIIAALPAVAARVPSVAYLIVGSGDDMERLRQLSRDVNVCDRVIFAGQVPQDELADHFALADVFAMPSAGEGFGIVFLEAAACGLPIIGGDRDGSVDALADGRIGRLVAPLSQEQIVAALIDALNGGQKPFPEAGQRFAFQNFVSHVDALLQSLVR